MKRFLTVLFVLGFLFIAAAGSLDANSIPKIGGNWNFKGVGKVNYEEFGLRGTASITTYVDSDGYEVITRIEQRGEVFDDFGRIVAPINNVFTQVFKITSKSFTVPITGGTAKFDIESSTRIIEVDKYSLGSYNAERILIWTRGESESSGGGGGCQAGASSPFALLLVLPLAFLAFKKCR